MDHKNNRRLQEAFELQVTSEYGAIENKPTSKEIEAWLNFAKDEFFKTRYSGVNFKGLAYEQDQKRTEDLANLKVTKELTMLPYKTGSNEYIFEVPKDYFILTREAAFIMPETDSARKCWRKRITNDDDTITYFPYRVQVMEANDDNIESKLNNKLSNHLFQGSTTQPLRVRNSDTITLYTDTNYSVQTFQITYLRNPKPIDLHTDPTAIYTEFPVGVLDEIVKIAVRMFIENKSNPRYQTITNELSMAE